MTRLPLRNAATLGILLSLSACGAGPQGPRGAWRPRLAANPSTVITTELEFARAARENGQWRAFRDYATKDALWPAPQFMPVQQSLKGQSDPEQAIVWEPDAVWLSCDGAYALSTGPATYPSGRRARYNTIWQRQRDGEYRWVLDQGFELEDGYAAPEMISGRVADCPERSDGVARPPRPATPQRGLDWTSASSPDGTLAWNTRQRADCTRTLVVRMLEDGEMHEVFRHTSAPPVAPPGEATPTCTPVT